MEDEELYDQPADMTFTEEEVHGPRSPNHDLPAADMDFTIEEVHGGEHSGVPPAAHHGEDEHDLYGSVMHALHYPHMIAEGIHAGVEGMHLTHDAHTVADAARQGVTVAPAAAGPAMSAGSVGLGVFGMAIGANQIAENLEDTDRDVNDRGADVVGGGLTFGAGALETASGVAGLAFESTALAPAAAVAAAGAVGYGTGRALDGPVGEGIGMATRAVATGEEEMAAAERAQREGDGVATALGAIYGGHEGQAGRGMNAEAEVVERNDSLSDRIADAAAGRSIAGVDTDEQIDSEFERGRAGRAMATRLPQIAGGDQSNDNFFSDYLNLGDNFNAAFGTNAF